MYKMSWLTTKERPWASFPSITVTKKGCLWAGEVGTEVKALSVLPENLNSIPRPTWPLTTVYIAGSRGSNTHICRRNTNAHQIKIKRRLHTIQKTIPQWKN